jgi:hypothetical protein
MKVDQIRRNYWSKMDLTKLWNRLILGKREYLCITEKKCSLLQWQRSDDYSCMKITVNLTFYINLFILYFPARFFFHIPMIPSVFSAKVVLLLLYTELALISTFCLHSETSGREKELDRTGCYTSKRLNTAYRNIITLLQSKTLLGQCRCHRKGNCEGNFSHSDKIVFQDGRLLPWTSSARRCWHCTVEAGEGTG